MEGFEEKLNTILGDPQAMGQIMALARSLGGGEEQGERAVSEEPSEESEVPFSSADRLMGEMDPHFMQIGLRLLEEYQRRDDRKTALLTALRPFVKEKRYAKLDKAIQIARLSRMIRTALEELGKEGKRDV